MDVLRALGAVALLARCAAGWVVGAPPRWRPKTAVAVLEDGDDGAPLPTIEEALASADRYDGPGIVDPYYMHPDTYPVLHEWTAEDFSVDLEATGCADWVRPTEAWVFYRPIRADRADLRASLHLDHLFWARESRILADRAGGDAPRVHAAQSILDESGLDVAASLVAVSGGDAAAARALLAKDPLVRADCFEDAREFHWTVADDPYLQIDVWPEGDTPWAFLRLDDAGAAAAGTRAKNRERHLSFLRKTRRCVRAGPLRPLDDVGGAPVGSLVYAFHADRERALAWAAADPYATSGVFPAGDPAVASTYCDFDVTGAQITRPEPLNELPDPLLARLVDAGLVELETRVVDRIDRDPETGVYERYNITTTDPRVQSNVDVDDEMMATFASTPKALRAKRKREREARDLEAELEENQAQDGDDDRLDLDLE